VALPERFRSERTAGQFSRKSASINATGAGRTQSSPHVDVFRELEESREPEPSDRRSHPARGWAGLRIAVDNSVLVKRYEDTGGRTVRSCPVRSKCIELGNEWPYPLYASIELKPARLMVVSRRYLWRCRRMYRSCAWRTGAARVPSVVLRRLSVGDFDVPG